MDIETANIIKDAVQDGFASSSWILLLCTLIGAAIGAFIGSYLKRKGEQRAINEDFGAILRQIHAQTRVSEEVKRDIAKELSRFENRLNNRSEFEQHLLLERYKLISQFASRFGRLTTDLNRRWHGKKVEGLFDGNELLPLTAIYEDLSASSFQLSEKFY